jgi:hypothetical protein
VKAFDSPLEIGMIRFMLQDHFGQYRGLNRFVTPVYSLFRQEEHMESLPKIYSLSFSK